MKNLVKLLTKKKITISFAESCTGGMLASDITSVSGASKIFRLGLVTYSNQAKISVLKINKRIIKKYGAVSPECCAAMVNNLAKISKAQINVSINQGIICSQQNNQPAQLKAVQHFLSS